MSATLLARAALSGGIAVALALLAGCGAGQPAAVAEPTTAAGFGAAPVGPDPAQPGTVKEPAGAAASQPATQTPQPGGQAGYPVTARAYAEATVAAWSAHDLSELADLTTPG